MFLPIQDIESYLRVELSFLLECLRKHKDNILAYGYKCENLPLIVNSMNSDNILVSLTTS